MFDFINLSSRIDLKLSECTAAEAFAIARKIGNQFYRNATQASSAGSFSQQPTEPWKTPGYGWQYQPTNQLGIVIVWSYLWVVLILQKRSWVTGVTLQCTGLIIVLFVLLQNICIVLFGPVFNESHYVTDLGWLPIGLLYRSRCFHQIAFFHCIHLWRESLRSNCLF